MRQRRTTPKNGTLTESKQHNHTTKRVSKIVRTPPPVFCSRPQQIIKGNGSLLRQLHQHIRQGMVLRSASTNTRPESGGEVLSPCLTALRVPSVVSRNCTLESVMKVQRLPWFNRTPDPELMCIIGAPRADDTHDDHDDNGESILDPE